MTFSNNDLTKAYRAMKEFLSAYENENDPGFELKTVHTYHVADYARIIAEGKGFSEEDRNLAVLIGLLHDVGRFEELRIRSEFNSTAFDHASYGAKMLEEGLIRKFIETDQYDSLILEAIRVHSLYRIPQIEDERTRMHALLLRDADKLDNLRSKAHEPVSHMFGNHFHEDSELADSLISEPIMNALRNHRCADIRERKTPLDYYVTVIGFWFDLSFETSRTTVIENRWIEIMVNRFDYTHPEVRKQMDEILSLTVSEKACAQK